MKLFDAHNHLQDKRLAGDLDGVMARAAAAGVGAMMVCGSGEDDWPAVRELSRRFPGVRVSFGVHPWYVDQRSRRWLDVLRAFLAERPSAVGEIGLDYAIEPRDDAEQEEVFLAQLRLSRELGRPATIHCRRAWGRMLEILRAEGPHPPGLVLHSFSGGRELVRELAVFNAFFSFSASLTFPNNRRGPEALRAVPPDRLLIETDAPDIPPAALREGAAVPPVNEPCHLLHTLVAAARHLGKPEEELALRTAENAERVFAPALPPAEPAPP